jgi:hypothetical protein
MRDPYQSAPPMKSMMMRTPTMAIGYRWERRSPRFGAPARYSFTSPRAKIEATKFSTSVEQISQYA